MIKKYKEKGSKPSTCIKYNRGKCIDKRCFYLHVCSVCNGTHPLLECPKRNHDGNTFNEEKGKIIPEVNTPVRKRDGNPLQFQVATDIMRSVHSESGKLRNTTIKPRSNNTSPGSARRQSMGGFRLVQDAMRNISHFRTARTLARRVDRGIAGRARWRRVGKGGSEDHLRASSRARSVRSR